MIRAPRTPKIGASRPSVPSLLIERRYVGLEIASDAIRGVMPRHGSPLTGSVELPPGAVVYGEIIDADAVRDAIRELWASAEFPTKRVVLGLNNQDVVTRVVDMPELEPKDMRSALPFELADLMPFALEDAIIDHRIIEGYESEDGHARMRVLAVIAVRDSVRKISSVLESAGLTVSHIDVTAMALVRAVATDESDHVHAIIEVGRDTLTIVIHHGSEVHFCRSLVMQESEGEVWAEFQAELQLIEQYRSRGEDAADMPIAANAFASGDHTINGIAGSLEYYALQDGARPLDRVSLVGDATRAWAIAPRLSSRLNVEVDLPDPLRTETGNETDDDEVPVNRAEFVAAYGLALPPVITKLNRGRLNLRPLRENGVPAKVMAIRGAVACALTIAALVPLTSLIAPDATGAETDLAGLQARLAGEQRALRGLSDASKQSTAIDSLQHHVANVQKLRIDFARLFQEVRVTAPPGTTITALVAQDPTPDPKHGEQPGQIQITAHAGDQTAIASWLNALGKVKGFERPWLSNASSATPTGETGPQAAMTNFTITVLLTHDARIDGESR